VTEASVTRVGRVGRSLTLIACVTACSAYEPVNPPPIYSPDPPASFAILALLHGTQSGAEDHTRDVALDAQGNVYVAGGTADRNFHTTASAYQRVFGRGLPSTSTAALGNWDVFVMKFAPDGQLLWSTLLGGGNYDRAYAIEVDASGVYVAGRAGEGFPTSAGSIQPAFAGDNLGSGAYGKQDGFIAKLSLDGSVLLWSTYFAGPGNEIIRDIAVGTNGDVYAAVTGAHSFPFVTSGALQANHRGMADGVACRIASGGASARWCTFIGGSGPDGVAPSIRLDGSGNVYYLQALSSADAATTAGAYQTSAGGGTDLHLTKLSPNGALLFATYFGGNGSEFTETHNLWVGRAGDAYLAARTTSPNLPVTAGAFQPRNAGGTDGFVARISADGQRLVAATYLGGEGSEEIEGIGTDAGGNIVVSGGTMSISFPVALGAAQTPTGGGQDGFVAVLLPDLTNVVRATRLGGNGPDFVRALAVDGTRNVIYTGGYTDSPNFPTLGSGFLSQFAGRDAFLAGWRY
jgi:hypothetical protein